VCRSSVLEYVWGDIATQVLQSFKLWLQTVVPLVPSGRLSASVKSSFHSRHQGSFVLSGLS
jgi:hypothetical protein